MLFLLIFFLSIIPFFFVNIFFLYPFKKIIFWGIIFSSLFIKISLGVLFVRFFVFIYTFYYIKEEKLFSYFFLIVFLFVLSMLILTLSNSIFIIFIGWDGLGITSFILIIFYNNWKRINNSVITLIRNRIGDGIILLFFGLILWDLFYCLNSIFILLRISLVIFISITKRAQTPVSAWLPAAIAAPTPVRALVHSSTLVRAGVVLLLKFFFMLNIKTFQIFLFFVGLLTIIVAGISSLIEIDFKKLVALSTLRQIGILFFILGLGRKWFSVFHFLSHAFFKSCLFLIVGTGLHFIFSQQDWRSYNFISSFSISSRFIMFLCLICLCGLFFSSGFVSKDIILDFINNKKISLLFIYLFLFSLFLTFAYSIRLFFSVLQHSSFNQNIFFLKTSFLSDVRPLLLFLFSLCFCYWIINNNFLFFRNLVKEKVFLLFIFFYYLFFLLLKNIKKYLIKSMFFLDYVIKHIFFEKLKKNRSIEKLVLDYFLFSFFTNIFNYLSFYYLLLNKNYKFNVLFIIIISFFILFFLYFFSLIQNIVLKPLKFLS